MGISHTSQDPHQLWQAEWVAGSYYPYPLTAPEVGKEGLLNISKHVFTIIKYIQSEERERNKI